MKSLQPTPAPVQPKHSPCALCETGMSMRTAVAQLQLHELEELAINSDSPEVLQAVHEECALRAAEHETFDMTVGDRWE